MRVFKLCDFIPSRPQAIALGYFDGGHIGHRAILSGAAATDECESAVFSFPTLPTKSGVPLSSLDDRLAFFEEMGISNVILAPFDEIKDLTAEAFVKEILIKRLHARMAFCGFNYHFGKGARGDTALLSQALPASVIFPPTLYKGEAVSTTRIRHALLAGEVEDAAKMLGKPYTVSGIVIHGAARGRTLGFPTANIRPASLLPRNGVYKTEVLIDGKAILGLSDVGTRPTVDGTGGVRVETFLPDFSGDLYDKRISVAFLSFLREEKKFDSLAQLQAQIALDLKKL